MNYKLICVDIDGTLLNDEKILLPLVEIAGLGIAYALEQYLRP